MKQKYFLVLTAILMVVVMNLRAQENLLQGGAMEAADESFWSISNLENAETSTTAYEFGYEGVSSLSMKYTCIRAAGKEATLMIRG